VRASRCRPSLEPSTTITRLYERFHCRADFLLPWALWQTWHALVPERENCGLAASIAVRKDAFSESTMAKPVLELLLAVLAGPKAELCCHRSLAPKWLGFHPFMVSEGAHHLNRTDDVPIKLCQFVGWNPIFPMDA